MEHRDFPMPQRRQFGSTDIMVPELSFGASGLGLVKEGSSEEEEAVAAVRNALRCGVNYFDTAPWYGQGRSEEVLGKALEGLSRDAFYAATKVGRYEPDCERMFDFSGSRTLESVRESLEKMKLTYFDVVQVHDVEFASSVDVIVNETLPALERLRCAGIIRYIGITGYPLHVLREVLQKSSVRVDTVLSYCRGTLFDDSLADYLPFFQETQSATRNAAGRCSATMKMPQVDTAGVAADPIIANFLSQQREVDTTPIGERMVEDAALTIYDDETGDDAGGCWKTVTHKRHVSQMHAKTQPSENILGIPDASQLTVRKRSRNENLPRLPLHDEKILLLPHGGLCLDKWTHPELASALWTAAGLSTEDCQDIIF
ncbi:uncharacterized protein LOC142573131 isoform X1 [Dermacentor variabilis]|uniref:uncharacterized protein LOC142573131 isoform X1 n=1 Tax=Dermacentor variabilis TaxID=34621 RepID=UPI003F5C6FE4